MRLPDRIVRVWLALLPLLAIPWWQAEAQQHAHQHAGAAQGADISAEIEAVKRATERYRDHANAVADGFQLFGQDGPLMGEHWYRRNLVRAPLDLERPSTLQYVMVAGQRVLVGVAYSVYRQREDPLPEGFPGNADKWHVHDIERIAEAVTEGRPILRWIVQRRQKAGASLGDGRTQLTMLHAWVWQDNPDGVFALENRALPYLRVGLPAAWAEAGDVAAAWGTSLLEEGACKRELRRLHAMARLADEQRSTLASECAHAAAEVAAARTTSGDAVTFNRTVAAAWLAYSNARNRTLTTEQIARVGSFIEHDTAGHRQHR
jgi:hypothetical protein